MFLVKIASKGTYLNEGEGNDIREKRDKLVVRVVIQNNI